MPQIRSSCVLMIKLLFSALPLLVSTIVHRLSVLQYNLSVKTQFVSVLRLDLPKDKNASRTRSMSDETFQRHSTIEGIVAN